jgi:zinc-finger of acetyl-transferase ESCO
VKCPECGLEYVESSPSDRRLHRRVHREVVNGPYRLRLRRCNVVWKRGSRCVAVINSQSPRTQRLLAQEVSLVAAGDTDYTGVAYAADERSDSRQIHLFLGVSDDRAKAYVCFERRFHIWHCTRPEYAARVPHRLDDRPMWSIGYAWVSRKNRRTGWLRDVLSAARDHLGFGNDFGWYTPFTDTGEAAARALCPSGIFIAG